MEEIRNYRFIGIEHIPEMARAGVERLLETHSAKICKHMKESAEIVLHCKEYSKDGTKHKYSIHGRIEAPGIGIVSAQAVNWEPKNAVHEVLLQLERQVSKVRL